MKDIEKYSKVSSIIHFVTHHKEEKLFFGNNEININKVIENVDNNVFLVVMNVCSNINVNDISKYPLKQVSIANKLLNEGVKHVITHNWELSQEASYIFSDIFYEQLIFEDKIYFPKILKNQLPLMYGGYMIWGI